MITIDFNSLNPDQDELKETCINYISNIVGIPEKITVKKDDEKDPESSFSVLFLYKNFTLKEFSFFDELMEFARENELYVTVSDHIKKIRKGFWYDEEDEWITQKIEN